MEVKVTMEYGLFKTISTNRPTSEVAVKRLIRSIEEIDLTKYKPIIVDCAYNIIDGQHRFEACRALGLPIYYFVLSQGVDSELAMIVLNKSQKNWRQEEFLNFWANTKGGRWKDMQDFDRKYKLGISNSVVIYPDVSMSSADIKRGTREFSKSPYADNIAEFLLSDEVRLLKFSKTRPFVLAIRKAFEKYNGSQLRKLKCKLVYLQMSANYEQYLNAFDNLLR